MAYQVPANLPHPFQRYGNGHALSQLTWQQCFAFNLDGIRNNFVAHLQNAPDTVRQYTREVKARADMLQHMLGLNKGKAESVVVLQSTGATLKAAANQPGQRALDVEAMAKDAPLAYQDMGFVEWNPIYKGGKKLQCYTVFDLLAASMSQAAIVPDTDTPEFLEALLHLFADWCVKIRPNTKHIPGMSAIIEVSGMLLLGCTIPDVPELQDAKEMIRETKKAKLMEQSLKEDKAIHAFLNVVEAKSMEGKQRYGNCAETSSFPLLCMLSKDERVTARGLALEPLTKTLRAPCDNCHRMLKLCIEDDGGRNGRTIRAMQGNCWWQGIAATR